MQVGIDTVEIKRIEVLLENKERFLYRAFSLEEQQEFEKRNKIVEQYRKEYEQSKQLFKERMQQYETNIQQALILNGKKLSRWKNESHLYAMVSKVYPDAMKLTAFTASVHLTT